MKNYANKKEVFDEFRKQLKKKNVPEKKLQKIEKEFDLYTKNLQSKIEYKLKLSLKKFIEARR